MDKSINSDLISVIIPVYNSDNFIVETVNSVLNQSYSNFEIIIVNDGSTDNTMNLLTEHFGGNKKIKIVTQINAGQAAARNNGIKSAQGKWIALIDADDLWLPPKLEMQMNVVINNPSVDLLFCGCVSFLGTNEIKNSIWESGFKTGKQVFVKLFSVSGITNSSVLVKKEIIVKAGYFNEATIQRGTEDYEMWLKLAYQNYNFYSMSDYLVKYRLHPMGEHNNRTKMLKGAIAALNQYERIELIPYIQKVRRFRECFRELFKERVIYQASEKEIRELIQELKKIDIWGIITFIQSATIILLPPKYVLIISQFLYRLRPSKNLPF